MKSIDGLPGILATVVVGPHDKLVIVLPDDTSSERVVQMRAQLSEIAPDLTARVLFVAGAQQLAVLRGEDEAPATPDPAFAAESPAG